MNHKNEGPPVKKTWNFPVAHLVLINVSRKDYINVARVLTDRGVGDIFFCDRGVWLPHSEFEAIAEVQGRFAVKVISLCSDAGIKTTDEAVETPPRLQLAR